jgi:RNA 3'-terminal phosphate cyclase (ATP)
MSKLLLIDGGAGGGQMLRTALALSLATGQPFRMTGIRAGRPRPGLMRQHLTCVRASAEISDGCADGAEPGSIELVFRPGDLRSGSWNFSIGTAGSVHLLLQTLLPALLATGHAAELRLEGGTHNPMAPPAEFISAVWLPLLRRMGVEVDYILRETGFAPAGGGIIDVKIGALTGWNQITLLERGAVLDQRLRVIRRGVSASIAERIFKEAGRSIGWDCHEDTELARGPGQGIVCQAEARFEQIAECVTHFGERGVSAENVARRTAKAMQDYLGCGVPVGRCLADQLLLPMALAGGGEFLTMHPDDHFVTNRDVIEKFLPVKIRAREEDRGRWRVVVG